LFSDNGTFSVRDKDYSIESALPISISASMAAPHVSGALAALKSKDKKAVAVELTDRIYETATPLSDRNKYRRGFLNFAYATLLKHGFLYGSLLICLKNQVVLFC